MKISGIVLGLILIVIVSPTMLITSPAINDFENSTIPYSYANFGNIPYGKTLTFILKQMQIDLCQNLSEIQHITQPTYLLVDASRGTCSYTTQAINAQNLGAKGIVFISDMIKYSGKVIQVDDGNGRKVHISVLFISPQSYRKLHNLKNINIKVLYEVYKTDKVNFTYFLSASGRTNYIFLREFMPFYSQIKDYINFKPLYLTFQCPFCMEDDCLIEKNYCSFQMDSYKQNVGQLIVKEQLRQWNIWKKQGTQQYLKYMDNFDKYCTANWFSSEDCGKDIMNKNDIPNSNLDESPSQLMDQWKAQEISAGLISVPEITINENLYVGNYEAEQVFQAICQSLSNPPSACTQQPSTTSNKLGIIITVIIFACLLSITLGFFLYKKCIKKQLTKDMFSKVNELVAKYATRVSQHNKKRKQRLKMRLNQEL